MADVLKRVDDAMRVVVGRVDAPVGARARVLLEQHAVRCRVPQRRVVRPEISLHPQEGGALVETPRAHPLEHTAVLSHAALAVGGGGALGEHRLVAQLLPVLLVRLEQVAALLDLVRGLVADVRATRVDQLQRELVQLLEVKVVD